MSVTSTGDSGKPMKQPSDDLSKAMGQLSVTTSKTSTPPKNLSDMPVDVVALIIERSAYREQLILRKVSKSLRALVDKQKPACKIIRLHWTPRPVSMLIRFDENVVIYTTAEWAAQEFHGIIEENVFYITRKDFEEVAFEDLASTLRNPKLRLETFLVDLTAPFSPRPPSILDIYTFNFSFTKVIDDPEKQLSVRTVGLGPVNTHQIIYYLEMLKPGVLERIGMNFLGKTPSWYPELDEELVEMEQWKQAKELQLEYCFDAFPMEYATHFKRFHLNEIEMDAQKLIRIGEMLSQLENFEFCSISTLLEIDVTLYRSTIGIPAPPNELTEYVSHYPIRDSDYYLEFMFCCEGVAMEKKKR